MHKSMSFLLSQTIRGKLLLSCVLAVCLLGLFPVLTTAQDLAAGLSDGLALYPLRLQAEKGDAAAQFNLAQTYYEGRGVEPDYVQAAVWYRKAAEQGMAAAQLNLGSMYYSGHGVTQDRVQAVVWYRKAAEQRLTDAQYLLGKMYRYGTGVNQDYAQATAWYRKAADQGSPSSLEALADLYATGEGVSKSAIAAFALYSQPGVDRPLKEFDAAYKRFWLAKKMSAEEIAEAQKLTQDIRQAGNLSPLDRYMQQTQRKQ